MQWWMGEWGMDEQSEEIFFLFPRFYTSNCTKFRVRGLRVLVFFITVAFSTTAMKCKNVRVCPALPSSRRASWIGLVPKTNKFRVS